MASVSDGHNLILSRSLAKLETDVAREERRLAAIVSADVVGYSRLMGVDESGTLAALRSHRSELIDPLIAEHGGRIVKTMGDGLLLEFSSVVAAVEYALKMQKGMAERNVSAADDKLIQFRIGVHLGDVVVDGDDIFGDGVNISARLETFCEANGVAISGTAQENIAGRIDASFVDVGEQELKNITRPVRVWQWSNHPALAAVATEHELPPLPDKPSIAVLPFENMSGDPEQEYFADGIAEDVITALSRFRSLFVIARNSSVTYKGQAADITQVARELGVRYVVEGSVRKAGDRVRITAQLIDAASSNHLWADRFDGSLDDIFELQDRITEQIVIAVEPEIGARERERARRKPPNSLDAWELLQRGLGHFHRINKADHEEAMRLFERAAEFDPNFALAHAYLAYAYWFAVPLGFSNDPTASREAAKEAAEQAVMVDPNEPLAHFSLGRLYVYSGEVEMALSEMRTAVQSNPNFARGHYGLAFAHHYGAGEEAQALIHYDAALRLSPRDPMRWMTLTLKGEALRTLGNLDDAIAHCRQACQVPNSGYLPPMHLAASLANAGQDGEARTAARRAMEINSSFSIGFVRDHFVGMQEPLLQSLLDSLRKAGVPE